MKEKKERTYFGGVEPDQIERIEIERRERTVENGPSSELSGGEAGDNYAGEFGIVAAEGSAVVGGGHRRKSGDGDGEEQPCEVATHFGRRLTSTCECDQQLEDKKKLKIKQLDWGLWKAMAIMGLRVQSL